MIPRYLILDDTCNFDVEPWIILLLKNDLEIDRFDSIPLLTDFEPSRD